ncbi:MAG TPA: anaerobic ribonucleoside triphosphate reductase [Erysipelotrichaceae bacterium]|nr:anaerobic ribonucleoside triphosphate reductase [Erysipelotrichaceae bacterium]
MKVIKRDGSTVDFQLNKIGVAVSKAFYALNKSFKEDEIEKIQNRVLNKIDGNIIGIEEIQDLVEDSLLELDYEDVFKEYVTYRRKRSLSRDFLSNNQHNFLKKLENIGIDTTKNHDFKRENANVDGNSPMGVMLQYGSTLSKEFTTAYLLDNKSNKAHLDGDIHIHDLDFYPMGTTTCLQIDLDRLFTGGFDTGHGHLREPNHITSYAALAAIAIQSNQNDQHGGQSIPMFDYYMAKGVIKTFRKHYKNIIKDDSNLNNTLSEEKLNLAIEKIDKLKKFSQIEILNKGYDKKIYEMALAKTDNETYKAMVGFIHNLNTMHSRAGAQVPFSSINFGTDISEAGRMVTKNYLLALESGLGNHETPIFPISIFKVKDGVNYNEDDVNYDLFKLACTVSAKRMFPNFSFIDAPFNFATYKEDRPETEVAYMGCRTRVVTNVNDEVQEVVSRGNLSFTSINLPRLAIKHGLTLNDKANEEAFFKDLKAEMDLVKDQLLKRFAYQTSKSVANFPFLLGQGLWKDSEGLNYNDNLQEVLKHGSLSIGFIGLAESLKALYGNHHGESEKSQQAGLKIIEFMRNTVDEYTKEESLNFTLVATPAEGLSGRFVKLDRDKFGEIEGVTDRDYYTNSFHVPVYFETNAKAKVEIEAPYHALTNGGHISYVELDGDLINNQKAFMSIVKMMKEAGIGYGAINHPLDRDPVCGFSGVIKNVCPGCNRQEGDVPFERIRRITGYLVGSLDRFNNAKLAEESDRVKHK